jgi:hypothetical protein
MLLSRVVGIAIILAITFVAGYAGAQQCPTPGEIAEFWRCVALTKNGTGADMAQCAADGFLRCSNAAGNPTTTTVQRCSPRWETHFLMHCLDSAHENTLSGIAPQQAPPPPRVTPVCDPVSLENCTCGPQLTQILIQRINQNSPNQSPEVKGLTLERLLASMGCMAPR